MTSANRRMIGLEAITFGYAWTTPIFDRFSWDVPIGETWSVLGPSGCGKTTLLYLLAGLVTPQAGHVSIDGELITRPRPQTGLILQDFGLLPWATVSQNAELGLKIRSFYGPDGKHAPISSTHNSDMDYWLERLGLAEHASKYPAQLSGGQRQRTAIARTLAMQPDLLLMDEPFSSLDAPTRESLQQLTLQLRNEHNLTLIIVTHAIEEAVLMGQKILLLEEPPNSQPQIIPNPNSSKLEYRNSQEYLELCKSLRARMGEDEPSI
jgi:ABC-type nitrate/sulfonate/bicarbonate transport system ATPase subunit